MNGILHGVWFTQCLNNLHCWEGVPNFHYLIMLCIIEICLWFGENGQKCEKLLDEWQIDMAWSETLTEIPILAAKVKFSLHLYNFNKILLLKYFTICNYFSWISCQEFLLGAFKSPLKYNSWSKQQLMICTPTTSMSWWCGLQLPYKALLKHGLIIHPFMNLKISIKPK